MTHETKNGVPDPAVELRIPEDDIENPKVTILVPCLNEESVIGTFIEWCKVGLSKLDCPGEILIVDSSRDRSAEIALAGGARVLKCPARGLGRAYIDAIPYARGEYIIMGDCDLTYDFRELQPFVSKLDEGCEYVMGTRMKGEIEDGAMPPLHRYFGTPLTTWMLNVVYGTRYSDIHCGMRAITRGALAKMNLESQSWEYASEMVLKASQFHLRIGEVPIKFYKDQETRVSVHKREGWFSPWKAGWINVKVMCIYAPDFFLTKPGWLAFIVGMLLSVSLAGGPYFIGPLGLSLHWMLLGMTMATMGYSAIQLGALARVYYNFVPSYTARMSRLLTFSRGAAASAGLAAAGFALVLPLPLMWIEEGFRLASISHASILGLLLLILAFQTFTFALLVEMMTNHRRGNQP